MKKLVFTDNENGDVIVTSHELTYEADLKIIQERLIEYYDECDGEVIIALNDEFIVPALNLRTIKDVIKACLE